jgi:uncharacterized membrane protein HdeD (DUF308 family)
MYVSADRYQRCPELRSAWAPESTDRRARGEALSIMSKRVQGLALCGYPLSSHGSPLRGPGIQMRNPTSLPDAEFIFSERYLGDIRSKSRWFEALGLALLIAGMLPLGYVLGAKTVSFSYIGAAMIIGGVAQILMAFYIRSSSGFVSWLLGGMFYALSGALCYYDPGLASTELTLLLAATLVVSGATRMGLGALTGLLPASGWLTASGATSCVAAILVALAWPANAPWVLGLWLTIDLAFQGAAALIFGLSIRARP